jgi:hypothetical protein
MCLRSELPALDPERTTDNVCCNAALGIPFGHGNRVGSGISEPGAMYPRHSVVLIPMTRTSLRSVAFISQAAILDYGTDDTPPLSSSCLEAPIRLSRVHFRELPGIRLPTRTGNHRNTRCTKQHETTSMTRRRMPCRSRVAHRLDHGSSTLSHPATQHRCTARLGQTHLQPQGSFNIHRAHLPSLPDPRSLSWPHTYLYTSGWEPPGDPLSLKHYVRQLQNHYRLTRLFRAGNLSKHARETTSLL